MTISVRHADPAARPVAPPPPREVSWRELSRGLWVGRAGDVHVATIEQGRRFTLIDPQEHAHRGFRTLDEAQAATGAIDIVPTAAFATSTPAEGAPSEGVRDAEPLTTAVLILGVLGSMAGIIGLGFELLLVR